jgi:predicted nucleic acid-binding protein
MAIVLRDPADERVLESALNGRADALITLNIDDFSPASHLRLAVIPPGAFLRRLQQEPV